MFFQGDSRDLLCLGKVPLLFIVLSFLLLCEFRKQLSPVVLEVYPMWERACVACAGTMFGRGGCFGRDGCHSQCGPAVSPLDRRRDWCCGDRRPGCGAGPSLPCSCTALLGQGLLFGCWSRRAQRGFCAVVPGGRDGSIPTARGRCVPALELSTGQCALLCPLPPEVTVAGPARGPTPAMAASAISPSESPRTAEVPPPDLTWEPTA